MRTESLVLAFVNSLTSLTAEMEGRHYGGGVLELVPSEIERLLIPVITASRAELVEADRRFRATCWLPSSKCCRQPGFESVRGGRQVRQGDSA